MWLEAPPQLIISRCPPPSVNATMIAAFKRASTFSYFLIGWLARFYDPLGPARYGALAALLPLDGLALMAMFIGRIAQALAQGRQRLFRRRRLGRRPQARLQRSEQHSCGGAGRTALRGAMKGAASDAALPVKSNT